LYTLQLYNRDNEQRRHYQDPQIQAQSASRPKAGVCLIVSGVGGVSFFIAQSGMDDASICWNMLPVMIGLGIMQAQFILLLDVEIWF
jgi:hypothetical protein